MSRAQPDLENDGRRGRPCIALKTAKEKAADIQNQRQLPTAN